MSLLVLSAFEVERIISTFPTEELEKIMAFVFVRLSSGRGLSSPPRISIQTINHTALFMPSRIEDDGTAIKVVSVPRSVADNRGLPASTIVIDEETGGVKAIVNARSLTALRTAAGVIHLVIPHRI